MVLIERLGSKPESKNSTQTCQWGLFECPVCKNHVEKPISKGSRNKTCGNTECIKQVKVIYQDDEYRSKLTKPSVKRTNPHHDAIRRTHKRLLSHDILTLSSELQDYNTFYNAIQDEYTERYIRLESSPIYVATNDGSPHITMDNITVYESSELYIPKDRFIDDLMYCTTKLLLVEGISRTATDSIMQRFGIQNNKTFIYDVAYNKRITYTMTKEQYEDAVNRYYAYKNNKAPTMLYLLKSGPYTKIGVTKDIENRIATLQTGSPFPITLDYLVDLGINCYKVEAFLHNYFNNNNSYGEWFNLCEDDILFIKDITSNDPYSFIDSFDNSSINQDYLENVDSYYKKLEEKTAKYELEKKKKREKSQAERTKTIAKYTVVTNQEHEHIREGKHNLTKHPIYNVWRTVMSSPAFIVSEEWKNVETFYNDVKDTYEEGLYFRPVDNTKPLAVNNYKLITKEQVLAEGVDKKARKVHKIDINTLEILGTYSSPKEAADSNNCIPSKVSSVCKGSRKTHAGFIWAYVDSYDTNSIKEKYTKDTNKTKVVNIKEKCQQKESDIGTYIDGRSNNKLYHMYTSIKNRITNPKEKNYEKNKDIPLCSWEVFRDELEDKFEEYSATWDGTKTNSPVVGLVDKNAGYVAGNMNIVSYGSNISSRSRGILQLDKKTGEVIKEWDSVAAAAKVLGVSESNVRNVCNGKRKSTGGFSWKYAA